MCASVCLSVWKWEGWFQVSSWIILHCIYYCLSFVSNAFIYVHGEWEAHTTWHLCWSKDKSQKSVISFYHVGLRDWTQVVRLGSNCLYRLSHFTGPIHITFWARPQNWTLLEFVDSVKLDGPGMSPGILLFLQSERKTILHVAFYVGVWIAQQALYLPFLKGHYDC